MSRGKLLAVATVTIVAAVVVGSHSAATLALEIEVGDATCGADGVSEIQLRTSGDAPIEDVVWHVWSQQQRTQFSWNASVDGSAVLLTAPVEEAQPRNDSTVQVAANIGQRRAYEHFKPEGFC